MQPEPLKLHQRVRAALPGFTFRPPASDQDILRVEEELGLHVPADIRELYFQFDGVDGPPESAIELLPLVGPGERESVLSWNGFRKGPGWEAGYEPPADVLELGFLNHDEYVGVRGENGEAVIVYRRGNLVEPGQKDLAELLADAFRWELGIHRAIAAEGDRPIVVPMKSDDVLKTLAKGKDGWDAAIPETFGTFFGRPVRLTIFTYFQVVSYIGNPSPPPVDSELALAALVLDHFPELLAEAQRRFLYYSMVTTFDPDVLAHVVRPNIVIVRNDPAGKTDLCWSFYVERDDCAIGYSVDFDGLTYRKTWAGS